MAEHCLTLRVVLAPVSPAELVERLSELITAHVAQCSEGVVPALLAEELVSRLHGQHALLFLDEALG